MDRPGMKQILLRAGRHVGASLGRIRRERNKVAIAQ